MIFVAVGSLYPFDRLIRACDELAAAAPDQDWLAQIHKGSYEPKHMRFERFIAKDLFDKAVSEAEFLVGHAGMGLINDAVSKRKPLLVVPRLRSEGEHVNDHQVVGAELFRQGGHVLVAASPDDVAEMIAEVRRFTPRPRELKATELANQVGEFLASC